jgi:ATP-dependent DNA helicase PcrA
LDWLAHLNERQRAAVTHTDGPLLVIAGAGSGKTRVLTYRIAYLLESGKALPSQILAVTFTNKAAQEMKERLRQLVGPIADSLWVGTFHATCVQILRRHADRIGYKRHFLIFDTSDQIAAMKETLKELNVDQRNFEPRAVLSTISAAKNELVDWRTYQERASDFWERNVGRFYEHYQKKLEANSAMDFDDLLGQTVRLFREHPDVLEEYQERFRYVLIDEYQDTNRAQYVLVSMICARHRNLCVVGDADQSIYRFRGADIRNILDFERDYEDAKVVKLEQNYRSTKRILEAANAVIENNLDRPDKTLFTENPEGELIRFYRAEDERDEAAFVAEEIERLRREESFSYQDITILYRTHAQSRTFEEEFIRRGMPYRIVSGVRFYERKEIKDLLAYLRLIANTDDELSLRRIINVPKRGIGDTTLGRIQQFADQEGITLFEAMRRVEEVEDVTPAYARRVKEFTELILGFREVAEGLSLTGLVDKVLRDTGYIAELQAEKSVEAEARIENLQEFLSVAKEFETQVESGLEAFLDHVALVSDVDAYEEGVDMVTMMTLHSAKGLEFPVVFLVGMEDGVFPHSRALWEPGELEEERRLCYVGMTRAMRLLYFTCAKFRTLYGQSNYNNVSRFVDEVPPSLIHDIGEERARARMARLGRLGLSDVATRAALRGVSGVGDGGRSGASASGVLGASGALGASAASGASRAGNAALNFASGEKVRHAKFGVGTVISVQPSGSDAILTVAFPGEGIKRLMASMAPLERV